VGTPPLEWKMVLGGSFGLRASLGHGVLRNKRTDCQDGQRQGRS